MRLFGMSGTEGDARVRTTALPNHDHFNKLMAHRPHRQDPNLAELTLIHQGSAPIGVAPETLQREVLHYAIGDS